MAESPQTSRVALPTGEGMRKARTAALDCGTRLYSHSFTPSTVVLRYCTVGTVTTEQQKSLLLWKKKKRRNAHQIDKQIYGQVTVSPVRKRRKGVG